MINIKNFINNLFPQKPFHLRHLLEFGIMLEERGEEVFRQIESRSQDDQVRRLAAQLAREEVEHRKLIEKILNKWVKLDVPVNEETRLLFEDEMRNKGIFVDKLSDDMDEKALLEYAFKMEDRMVKYYRGFKQRFNNVWKQEKVQIVIDEEEKHKMRLAALLKGID